MSGLKLLLFTCVLFCALYLAECQDEANGQLTTQPTKEDDQDEKGEKEEADVEEGTDNESGEEVGKETGRDVEEFQRSLVRNRLWWICYGRRRWRYGTGRTTTTTPESVTVAANDTEVSPETGKRHRILGNYWRRRCSNYRRWRLSQIRKLKQVTTTASIVTEA